VRWETEWSFDDKLYQEYSYQKLSESVTWFSSYNEECRGCFFETVFHPFFIHLPTKEMPQRQHGTQAGQKVRGMGALTN